MQVMFCTNFLTEWFIESTVRLSSSHLFEWFVEGARVKRIAIAVFPVRERSEVAEAHSKCHNSEREDILLRKM